MIIAGTVGHGLLRSDDGEAWTSERGVPPDAAVFSLAAGGGAIHAGGRGAIYRRSGGEWHTLSLDGPDLEVWALGVDPRRPSTLYAGCRPLALLCSDDAGVRWRRVRFDLPARIERPHTPRITAILVDGDWVWCAVEVGGVYASADGGGHWAALNDGLPSLDVHALAFAGPALVAATPRGIAWRGDRWQAAELQGVDRYCRALVALSHPGALLCGLGDGPPGSRGSVVRSENEGRSWRATEFPGAASSVWSVAAAGDLAVAGSIGGELFTSKDAGRSWRRAARDLGDLRAVLVV
jgi:photosystem II stability/assembly factor-like uncharacterized protein